MVLGTYDGTRDLGIVTDCDGSVSEHHEGRAWDWGVLVTDPEEKAMADRLLDWLLETDEHGNGQARMRRLGIMYMIWNERIISQERIAEGWRPSSGHRDHIHFSFTREGGNKETSWWDPASTF